MLKAGNILFLTCVFITFTIGLSAQQSSGNLKGDTDLANTYFEVEPTDTRDSIVTDAVIPVKRNENGLIVVENDWNPLYFSYTFADTMFYDPSFLPVVFDGKLLPENIDFRTKYSLDQKAPFHLISPENTLKPLLDRSDAVQQQRRQYYMEYENFDKIKYSNDLFYHLAVSKEEAPPKKNVFHDLVTAEGPGEILTPEIHRVAIKPIHWLLRGESSVQVSQNQISKNWNQGGNSSFMIRNYHQLRLDYKRGKVSFNNTIEWKLGIQSTSGDTVRDFTINEDQLRSYSVFGYQAFGNKWSYSSTLEMKTPLFSTYPENSKERRAALFSPLDINLGVGMSYSLEKKFEKNSTRKIKFSINLAPLSVNYRSVSGSRISEKIRQGNYGLKDDKTTKTDYGSLVNSNMEFNFNNYTVWTSRFKYFTNYERVEAEFENKLNMSLNRYFSTIIGVHLRFDDNGRKDRKSKYIQYNEILSFGLNYKW